ncbi:MAG TPA: tetratricopeptide repeat protein [Anaeromyxobacteraceae bacterium]|nr:tetratricopeptide repeat protein [Anaeromyxobacteraceae bacterium]
MPDRESKGWPEGGEPTTEVTLADALAESLADSIAGQIAARIEASPTIPGDALDWASIAAGYEREGAARAGDPAAAGALLFEAGRIFEEHLGSPAEALTVHRRAFELDPTFKPNLHAARRLATRLGDDAFVVDLLAAEARLEADPSARAELVAYRARWLLGLGRVQEGVAALESLPAGAPPSFALAEARAAAAAAAGDAVGLAEAWVRCSETVADAALAPQYQAAAATLFEEALGQPDRAAALFGAAFARRPQDPFLRSAVRRHARAAGRWDELDSLLRAEAEGASGREAAAAWAAAAWVEQSRLGRLPSSIECLQRAARALPRSPEILRALARAQEAAGELAGETEALAALAEVFAGRGAPAERKEAVDVLLRLATLQEMRGRIPEALDACREACALVPGERAILQTLGRLCARNGDFAGVAEAYLAEADAAVDSADRGSLLLRAAEVMEGRLGRLDAAEEKYREAVAADPSLLPAREALERLYTRSGNWDALVGLLETDLTELTSRPERVAHLFRIAQIQEERLVDPAAAATTWRRLLVVEPEHLVALRALGRCLEALGRDAELVEVLGCEGSVVEDPRRRAAIHARRAELLEERLSDPESARLEWEQVLGIDPRHVPAQRALGRFHARADHAADSIALLRREADAAPTPATAASILIRAGAIASRMRDGDDAAISLYREALTLSPDHLSALESLAGIYRRRGDAEPLVEVLRTRAAATTVPEVRGASLVEAARICEEKLADVPQAIAAFEEALAADPGQLLARAALDRLHAKAGRRDTLRALRSGPGSPPTTELLSQRVAMELVEGGDRAAARDAAQAIGRLRTGGAPAIVALAGGLDAGSRAQIRTVLSEGATNAGDIAVILLSAAVEQEPGVARDAILARAAAIAPDRAALAPHADDAARQGDLASLAARLQAAAEREEVPAYRAHWFVRTGEAWERAGDDDAALSSYRSALAVSPEHLPALRAARALLARQGDWAAVRGTLQVEGMARRDPAGSAAAWLRAGAIAEERFDDVESAARDYRIAAERDPSDPAALLRLEAVVAGQSSVELLELKRARAAGETEPARAAAAWLDVAQIASLTGGGAASVLGALDRALLADPALPPALALRARTFAEDGRIAEAVRDYDACVPLTPDPQQRFPLHVAAAALLQDSEGDPAAIRAHLDAALAIHPDSAEVLGRLARLHFDAQELGEAAAAVRRLADLPAVSPAARAEHLLGLAPIEAARGDLAASVDACRKALEARPGDARALRLLAEFEERRGNWPGLAAAHALAAETAPDPTARLRARIALARVSAERLGDRDRAIAQLTGALATAPHHDEARILLARLLEDAGSPLAVQEHLALIAGSPARVDSWAALYRIFSASGARDRAFVAAGVLSWLGGPSPGPAADALLSEGAARALPPLPVLAESDWDLIRHPQERGPLADVLQVVGLAIASALCAPVPARAQPLRPDPAHRAAIAELATAMGIEAWDLQAGAPGAVTDRAAPVPVLAVGPDLTSRSTPPDAARFLFGRALAHVRLNGHLAEALAADALGAAISAATAVVVPGYTGMGAPTDDTARRIGKALGRRERKALEPAARALAEVHPPPDLAKWRAAVRSSAERAGTVLCGSVPTALSLLAGEGSPGGRTLTAAERAAAAIGRPDVAALLAFAATEEHFLLRQRLRVALP